MEELVAQLEPGIGIIRPARQHAFERGHRLQDRGGGGEAWREGVQQDAVALAQAVLVPKGQRHGGCLQLDLVRIAPDGDGQRERGQREGRVRLE